MGLPNSYHMMTLRKLSWYLIGQHSLLLYPHFGIDFFQPPRFRNSNNSKNVALDRFLSSLLNNVQTSNSQCTSNKKNISSLLGRYPYRNGICGISVFLIDSKYSGKFRTLMTVCVQVVLIICPRHNPTYAKFQGSSRFQNRGT